MNHIEQTIADLDAKILKLQTARNALVDLLTPAVSAAAPRRVSGSAAPSPRPAETNGNGSGELPKRRGRPPTSAGAKGDRPLSDSRQAAIPHIRGFNEPFGTAELMGAMPDLDRVTAGNIFTRFKAKGWIENAGFGVYRRTNAFPGNRPGERLLADIHAEIDAEKKKDEE